MECFDRDQESARLWRHFSRGKNVLMLAPRRIGKTVLLNRLKEESEAKGFHAIILDVEGFRDERAFFQQMCSAIQEEIGVGQAVIAAFTDRFRKLVQGADHQLDWRSILLNTDWTIFADHLLAQLESETNGKPWVFLVDEIPVFTLAMLEKEGREKVHDFLHTLRNLRQKHRKVLWLYTGSIGMDAIARRNGMEGALVDMELETLAPFDRDVAANFIRHIADKNGRMINLDAITRILDRLGWLSPYYLEKIADTACDGAPDGQAIGAAEADRAADALLELSRRTYWATWREHLDKNFPEPERTHLFGILAALSHTTAGARLDTLLLTANRGTLVLGEEVMRGYLQTLEADGYLTMDAAQGRYAFRMNLLREWWVRYVAAPPFAEVSRG